MCLNELPSACLLARQVKEVEDDQDNIRSLKRRRGRGRLRGTCALALGLSLALTFETIFPDFLAFQAQRVTCRRREQAKENVLSGKKRSSEIGWIGMELEGEKKIESSIFSSVFFALKPTSKLLVLCFCHGGCVAG